MPKRAPLGWLKSTHHQSPNHLFIPGDAFTFLPCWRDLHGVDHLGVEAARHLDPNTARQQQCVQHPQVPLSIPWYTILLYDPCQHRVRLLCFRCMADWRRHLLEASAAIFTSSVRVEYRMRTQRLEASQATILVGTARHGSEKGWWKSAHTRAGHVRHLNKVLFHRGSGAINATIRTAQDLHQVGDRGSSAKVLAKPVARKPSMHIRGCWLLDGAERPKWSWMESVCG